ncbi:MAG: glycosyltransferase family 4 protein, partial [Candidatus Odinarchaeota archaeon]
MKKKIKVCFVSHFVYPLFNRDRDIPFGGKEVQFYLLSRELSKNKDLLITIITGDNKLKSRRIELYNNIKIYISLPTKNTIKNKLKGLIYFLLTLIQVNPDVVIQRGGNILTGLCTFYSKLLKKKFIFSIAHRNDIIKKGKHGLNRFFHWFGINNTDYIIAQNNEQIQEYEHWKERKILNMKVIKSGYEIKNFSVEEKRYILWISRAERWKKPELFMEIADKFPKKEFIMICPKAQDKIYWKTISDIASKKANLKFLNFIPFHEIDKYFREAKIFINTSSYEGFPNTFIQSFKNKTPVISLSVNPDNILIRHKIGIFCNDNLKKLELSIKQLFENQELYNMYSKNAFNYAKKN